MKKAFEVHEINGLKYLVVPRPNGGVAITDELGRNHGGNISWEEFQNSGRISRPLPGKIEVKIISV